MAKSIRMLWWAPAVLLAGGAVSALADREPGRRIVDRSCVTIYRGCDPVFRYRYGGVRFKPYVDALWTPGMVNLLRDSPHDHLHHHGLMYAITVDGVNFWEEAKAPGVQRVRRPLEPVEFWSDRCDGLGVSGMVEWVNPQAENQVLLLEKRQITWMRLVEGETPPTIVAWSSRFTLPAGREQAVLSGTAYHGLGARFVESVDREARLFNADGGQGVDGTNAKTSKWCALHAEADGKPVTFAMFDPPKGNPRPAVWFTMIEPFTYMSATWGLDQKPLTLKAGETVSAYYAVAAWDGHVKPEEIDATYKRWVELCGRGVVRTGGE
jgi:hypothetical protein